MRRAATMPGESAAWLPRTCAAPASSAPRAHSAAEAPSAEGSLRHGRERARVRWSFLRSIAADVVVVPVAALDEPPLRLERAQILVGELAAEIVERAAGGVEPGDEPLVDGQSFAVALPAILGRHPLVALDQLG